MLSLGGLVSNVMLGKLNPRGVLGSKLKSWFFENYSSATGNWVDEIKNGSRPLRQATVANRPTESFTPAGFRAVEFLGDDGANSDLLIGGSVTGLPATYSGEYMCFFVIRENSLTVDQQIIRSDGDNIISQAGDLWFFVGADSDASVIVGQWYTIIGISNSTNVRLWVNGVLQTTTGGGTTVGTDWDPAAGFFDAFEVGSHNNAATLNGRLASLGFAHSLVPFTSNEIADLHTVLRSYVTNNDTIATILGSRLYRWYLNYTTGTWTCNQSSGNATQATGVNQPTATTFVPGQTYPDFDGSAPPNHDFLTGTTLSTLPTYDSADHFIWGALLGFDTAASGVCAVVAINTAGGLGNTDSIFYTNGTDRLVAGDCNSNVSPIGTGIKRVIILKNGTSGVLTMYINGVAQTTTGTNNFGQFWKTDAPTIGTQPEDTTRCLDGKIASMFFGYSPAATPFSSEDVARLDLALANIM